METAHKHWWRTFEVVFAPFVLAALLLQWLVPISFDQASLSQVMLSTGSFALGGGTVFIVLARQELRCQGQPREPGRPTRKLVTTGVFSISRNPLYAGGACVLAGIAVIFNLPWMLLLLLPALVVCHVLLIAPEERYLAATFGEEYQTYTHTVGRWIGWTRHTKAP